MASMERRNDFSDQYISVFMWTCIVFKWNWKNVNHLLKKITLSLKHSKMLNMIIWMNYYWCFTSSQSRPLTAFFCTNMRLFAAVINNLFFRFDRRCRLSIRLYAEVKSEKNAQWRQQWWEQSADVKSHIHLTYTSAPTLPMTIRSVSQYRWAPFTPLRLSCKNNTFSTNCSSNCMNTIQQFTKTVINRKLLTLQILKIAFPFREDTQQQTRLCIPFYCEWIQHT